jgi:hypothetical protein
MTRVRGEGGQARWRGLRAFDRDFRSSKSSTFSSALLPCCRIVALRAVYQMWHTVQWAFLIEHLSRSGIVDWQLEVNVRISQLPRNCDETSTIADQCTLLYPALMTGGVISFSCICFCRIGTPGCVCGECREARGPSAGKLLYFHFRLPRAVPATFLHHDCTNIGFAAAHFRRDAYPPCKW